MLAAKNSPDKLDLSGKISTKSKAQIDPFLDQFSIDLAEDEIKVLVYLHIWQLL